MEFLQALRVGLVPFVAAVVFASSGLPQLAWLVAPRGDIADAKGPDHVAKRRLDSLSPAERQAGAAAIHDTLRAAERANITGSVVDSLARSEQLPDLLSKASPGSCAGASRRPVLRPFRTRDMLGQELRRLGLRGVGVEVGVQSGHFTRLLLESWQTADLFIQVDLWSPQTDYVDGANVGMLEQMIFMSQAREAAVAMRDRGFVREVAQCRNFSTVCAALIPDGALDFVYLDARHDRDGVLADLWAYWPKVRLGGVIAGDDYTEQAEPDMFVQEYPNRGPVLLSRCAFEPCTAVPTMSPSKLHGNDWTVGSARASAVEDASGTGDQGTKTAHSVDAGAFDIDSNRAVKGAVDDFFGGLAAAAPSELRACPRQVVVSYREPGFNTWAVVK